MEAGPKIMGVEPDDGVREALFEVLRDYGVVVATTAEEAREILGKNQREEGGSIRVVVMEIELGDLYEQGFALASAIKQEYPKIKILLYTAARDWEIKADSRQNLFNAILYKPASVQVVERVAALFIP